jgi:hypothetical protein
MKDNTCPDFTRDLILKEEKSSDNRRENERKDT